MINKLCLVTVSFRVWLYSYISMSENLTHVQRSSCDLHCLCNYVIHTDWKRKSLL